MNKKSPICGAFFMLCVQIHAWNEPSGSWVNKTNGRNNPTARGLTNPRGNINRPIRGLIIFLSLLLKAACARRLLGDFGTPFFVHSFEIERESEELCAGRAHRFHIRQHLMVFQGAAPLAVEHIQQAEHEFEFGLHFEERQVGIAA